MQKAPDTRYEQLATECLFKGTLSFAALGLEYRKNKSQADVKKAVVRIRKPSIGHAKVEHEIGMLELYLREIFKNATPAPAEKGTTEEVAA